MAKFAAFMKKVEPEIVTIPGLSSFRDENGNILDLQMKALTTLEIEEIRKGYRTKKVACDKKGNPLIFGGQLVYDEDFDSARATEHMIVETLVFPDLKDKDLMEFYGVVDSREMPRKVFSRMKDFEYISNMVLKVNGLSSDAEDDTEQTVNEIKNG